MSLFGIRMERLGGTDRHPFQYIRYEASARNGAGEATMIVAIIQARMGSTRLPGKVAMLISCRSMLAWVIQRAKRIVGVESVVVATTQKKEDHWVLDESHRCGVQAFQENDQDVLTRYDRVATHLSLNHDDLIVRITADCPLLDPLVSARVIKCQTEQPLDDAGHVQEWPVFYAGNTRDWPDGLDTEVFTRHALKLASRLATSDEDREHVTPWMRRYLFSRELMHLPSLRHIKFSVDTEEDLESVREVYNMLGPDCGWEQIVTFMTSVR